ncbi:hypothetical protein D3C87_1730990 [compost metagenome]
MKIYAVQQQACRMQATEMLFDAFVNQTVIRNGRFPAHSTYQADRFHIRSFMFPPVKQTCDRVSSYLACRFLLTRSAIN